MVYVVIKKENTVVVHRFHRLTQILIQKNEKIQFFVYSPPTEIQQEVNKQKTLMIKKDR